MTSFESQLTVAEEIRVRGTVQGVGFRPMVYRLAKACGLRGEVGNDGQGVWMRVVGDRAAVDWFVEQLPAQAPPLAKIEQILRRRDTSDRVFSDFTIVPSTTSPIQTAIVPDAATCPTCQREIFDPFSRWYRYPFTNCSECGPRLSIIQRLPYDRRHTSMAAFALCRECAQDYADPTNRRFHAQPTACHRCGPRAWLERADGQPVTGHLFSMLDDVDAVCTLLQRGQIVAIKGLGGFHLACDATNEQAVQTLRQRKQRPHKPLALMARDWEIIAQYCTVGTLEKDLLHSCAAPIVLMPATGYKRVAPSVAPGQNTLGFMLPYTPLHHLLLRRLEVPIVLTSGNLADDPQCIDNAVARSQLGKVADYFLFHNREIVNRVDDSVVRVVGTRPQLLRRARGYAPAPITLPDGFASAPPILAMGGELKNTFCLLRANQAIVSQHLGDLEKATALAAYQQALQLYLGLWETQPEVIALDLHPEYLSTKLGQDFAADHSLPLHWIQHHHAHIAACMAENGLPLATDAVLGIALDGLGYGEDHTFWGGEFLLADYRGFQRLATFKPVAMLGGKQAIQQPWRSLYAHLKAAFPAFPANLEREEFWQQKPLKLLDQILDQGINSPLASSGGRLFDAVAAALGICRDFSSYEGQGAIALEALAQQQILSHPKEMSAYPFAVDYLNVEGKSLPYLEPRPMWQALLDDLNRLEKPQIAAKFHRGLANAIASMVEQICPGRIEQIVLSGGGFQNQVLLELVSDRLHHLGLQVLTHSVVPPNDGGLSLGQSAIAAARCLQNHP